MNKPIERDELQHWLEKGKPVTILDVQPEGAYEEWHIPGSVHLERYDALKAGADDAMHDVELPTDRPIVTVCPRGKTSALAAEQLRERGYDAQSLAGGLHEWSQAWNSAEVELTEGYVSIVQVRRTGKGCLSYLIGSDGIAAVVDASVDANVYLQLAEDRGWRITAVLETHIQADHLSRSKQLADETDARLYLPAQDRVSFQYTPLSGGDVIRVGEMAFEAIPTPGHTPESISYLLGNALFTGDTLFRKGVGRPDLDASEEEATGRAADLHKSIRKLAQLPRGIQVLPTHTAEPVPFDGVALQSSMGDVRERLEPLSDSKEAFIESVTRHLPPPPPNFERIVELNETGKLPDQPSDLEAGANRCAA